MTNRDKNEDEVEKFGKMSPIFELSISKLGDVAILITIPEILFDPF